MKVVLRNFFFFSSRRRHTRCSRDWSSDVCSSDLFTEGGVVRSYGNRYYHKPVITGEVKWLKPITVDWWKYAQSLTKRPVKGDRKSTRLNSSHGYISYAVFCLKKKKKKE